MITNDNDFIDLDISSINANRVVIAIHGLEGSSNSNYIQSITKVMNDNNYDVIAVNLRGCSGEPNKLLSSYHSGKTDDLFEIIEFIEANYSYEQIHIVGYSLGGNITLKFMGEYVGKISDKIKSAVAVSAPCDLKSSAIAITKFSNKLYLANFLKTLKVKALEKLKRFPNANLDEDKIINAKNFYDFDEFVTAPTHGFKSAEDYWSTSSSKQFLPKIEKPTLLITALDDPFLGESCYPNDEAKQSKYFYLLPTKYGGHVGFSTNFDMESNFWLESEILSFIEKYS